MAAIDDVITELLQRSEKAEQANEVAIAELGKLGRELGVAQAKLAAYEKTLREYADKENWGRVMGTYANRRGRGVECFVAGPGEHGYEPARRVLGMKEEHDGQVQP